MPSFFVRLCILCPLLAAGVCSAAPGRDALEESVRRTAAALLEKGPRSPGFIVHVGCGGGELTGALARASSAVVHGLADSVEEADAARRRLASLGVYGRASVDTWDGMHLPYADGMASLVILEKPAEALAAEARRVLAPLGVLLSRAGEGWQAETQTWPADIDEWTHYLHDSRNNAVAADTRIGPPRSLRWIGGPRWSRHHDRLASMSALVSAGQRLFYIFDEGPTSSIVLPSKWALIARDAFNGVVLWKRPLPDWQTRLWPLKSGPAQLPRRLVATRDRVFVTLGINVPCTALDAATGDTLQQYEGSRGTVEILHRDGILFLLVDPELNVEKYTRPSSVNKPWWNREATTIRAYRATTGELLWEHASPAAPLSLAVDATSVVFHDGERIVSLDRADGAVRWRSVPVPMVKRLMSFFAPTLVLADGVVLFAGGEESGLVKSTGGATKADTLTALDAETGAVLWTAEHPPSGYSSPEDLFVIGDTVWFAGVSNGNLPGTVTGLDIRTGAVKARHEKADVDTYWFHHRCYRGKASSRYLMTSRTGIEFIDPATGQWTINHWTRGGCLYGIMPANGLIYTPPHDCACYEESKFFGFSALDARSTPEPAAVPQSPRLEKGPAFDWFQSAPETPTHPGDWPAYRGGNERAGSNPTPVPHQLAEAWTCSLGGVLSAPTVADGRVFVAAVDRHTVIALDAQNGNQLWSYTAGGRIDSPPALYRGAAFFGSADGWITCLRATDGAVIWRFRAAPADIRIMSFEQLESRWPVHGSVLVQDGVVHAVAGRMLFLDGGMRFCRIDARTGVLLSENVLDDRDPETGAPVQNHVKRLTMPVALPDVLSSDGSHIYMRSQVFTMDGRRIDIAPHDAELGRHAAVQEGPTAHLFASSGFLDGSWFHRSYWLYGRSFEGGWNSYYLAGKRAPAGKILSMDAATVYGFGREPKYFRWTTPMEFQLFAVPRTPTKVPRKAPEQDPGTIVRVAKSKSLNPAGTALFVTAWVRPDAPDGVILAHGGGVLGYALYLKDGRAVFAVANKNRRTEAVGDTPLPKDWNHLAGVLTDTAELNVYLNGVLVGAAQAPALITADPANAMQIGADEESPVGTYSNGFPFKGDIDEVRVCHGTVSGRNIADMALNTDADLPRGSRPVLHFHFDNGRAADASGNKNNGTVVGAKAVDGKVGKALRFSGLLPDEPNPVMIDYAWTRQAPVLVRGLALAGRTLFMAGPEDVLDEPAALKAMDAEETRAALAEQQAAVTGEAGGMLLAVSCTDGQTVATHRLGTVPVWDGLAAARGRLYLAAVDGTVRCLAPEGN